ncbi:hypothetical protein [Mycobacterium sp. MAA66]|uniref:hypothetical protein n=1 Tax=Mycobacterium sp. MAA66 TaxID=3156297 RepID=UPI003515EC81
MFSTWRRGIAQFWQTPEGQQLKAAQQSAEAKLQRWLDTEPAVVVATHGGWASEVWRGLVDGHCFYFRERDDIWHIEIDRQPRGHFVPTHTDTDASGHPTAKQREIVDGEVIATGSTEAAGYGATPVERARFIVDTVRVHLLQRACTHLGDELAAMEVRCQRPFDWCPVCGYRLRQ